MVEVSRPWLSLLSAIVAMAAIGHCQYTWTLFVPELAAVLDKSEAQVQVGFSLFVAFQTTSVLGVGVVVPRRMHQQVMCAGSFIMGLALYSLSAVSSLPELYLSCSLMGLGVGCVYNGCVSLAVRLFVNKRGLVTGLTAAAYGGGSLFTVASVVSTMEILGYASALRFLGIGVGLTAFVASCLIPSSNWEHGMKEAYPELYGPSIPLSEAVRGGTFWLLYVMIVLITYTGLAVTAQLRPLAIAYHIPPSSLVLALQADRVLSLISRPAWGSLSDVIGRAHALAIAFSIQVVVLCIWAGNLGSASLFVVCSALSTFTWGEVYSLFPAIAADIYGTMHVSANFGALYTGKAVASVLAGPLTSAVAAHLSWEVILFLMAFLSLVDALLAALVLHPILNTSHRCSMLA